MNAVAFQEKGQQYTILVTNLHFFEDEGLKLGSMYVVAFHQKGHASMYNLSYRLGPLFTMRSQN